MRKRGIDHLRGEVERLRDLRCLAFPWLEHTRFVPAITAAAPIVRRIDRGR